MNKGRSCDFVKIVEIADNRDKLDNYQYKD